MKSFRIWLISVASGAILAYLLTLLFPLNIYLAVAAGIILGSSFGITINIQRSDDEELLYSDEPPPEIQKETNSGKESNPKAF